MERREFCVHACQVVSLATLGSALQGCAGSNGPSGINAPPLPTISGSIVSGAVNLTIGAGSPLATSGGAALVQTPSGSFLVSRTGDTFIALTAICTHQVCTITGFQSSSYVCPCHGSTYSLSGSVQIGPANRSLQQFATSFANNVLTIRVA